MMNQKTAVVNTILSVLSERGETYKLGGEVIVDDVLTETDRAKVRELIFAGFRKGEIQMDSESAKKYTDDSELKKYVSGLVNNWIRKCKDFNNGKDYVAKNPGGRAGSGDAQIREMKKLLGQTTNEEHKKLIQSQIDARLATIKPAKDTSVDASKLPENLRHLVK